jgi:hypothetical protein
MVRHGNYLVLCNFEIEGGALCVGRALCPPASPRDLAGTGDRKGRPYERTNPFNLVEARD